MDFPITVFPFAVLEHGVLNVLTGPIPLIGADGLQHPAAIWDAWTADDWARHRPHWRFLAVLDEPPAITAAQTSERRPVEDWDIDPDAGTVTITYRVTARSAEELAAALAAAKTLAVARANAEAGAARARFITTAIGQEGTYLDKAAEAEAFVADPAPSAERYPYLYAEAEATGTPVETVAATVRLTALGWRAINARIEGLRKGAGKRIQEALTGADIEAVFPIAWPTP